MKNNLELRKNRLVVGMMLTYTDTSNFMEYRIVEVNKENLLLQALNDDCNVPKYTTEMVNINELQGGWDVNLIKGVSIGDQYIARGKRQDLCTVTDIVERSSMKTGKVFDYECWVEYKFMGQIMKKQVAFASVIMGKLI